MRHKKGFIHLQYNQWWELICGRRLDTYLHFLLTLAEKEEDQQEQEEGGADEEPSGGSKKRKKKKMILPKQKYTVKCSWCKGTSHNEWGCEWKKFALEFPPENPMEEVNTEAVGGNEPMEEVNELPNSEQEVETENKPMEEMTQSEDIPPLTQESQHTENLEQVRVVIRGEEANVIDNLEQVEMRTIEKMTSHFIETNPYPPHPSRSMMPSSSSLPQRTLFQFPMANIRAPAPMVFHPNEQHHQRGCVMPSSVGVPVIKVGGKKFVTMANLEAAMLDGSKKKGSKKQKKDSKQ